MDKENIDQQIQVTDLFQQVEIMDNNLRRSNIKKKFERIFGGRRFG